MKNRLKKVEEQIRECDPSSRVMSHELFDLAVAKSRRGLKMFGCDLSDAETRRLVWWLRTTDAGKSSFGRSQQSALLGADPMDYGVENFDPDEFQVTNGRLELRCHLSD